MSVIDTERYMIAQPPTEAVSNQNQSHHYYSNASACSNEHTSQHVTHQVPSQQAASNTPPLTKPQQRGHRKHHASSSQSNSSGSIRSCTSIDNHNSHKQKKKTKTQLTHPAVDSARSATIGQASGGDVDANGKITNAGHAGHRPRRQSQDSQNRTHSQDSQNRSRLTDKRPTRDRSLSQDRSNAQTTHSERPMTVNMIGIVESLPWFHAGLTRHIAESILMQNGQDGAYLLRPCSKPGELALSVRCRDSVKHIAITHDGDVYHFGMAMFTSIPDFVQHFDNHPMIAGETGVLTQLKYPYPRDVEEPALYETVRIHAELGQASSPQKHQMFAVGSKEGYLTKRGAFMKNWQTRWFVLVKDELKYYGEKGDRSPKRTLQLSECKGCLRDYTQGKDNCLRLLFSKRTFYMYAATEEESREWMNLLLWKLENLHKAES